MMRNLMQKLHNYIQYIAATDRLPIAMCQRSKVMEINQPTFFFSLSSSSISVRNEPLTLKQGISLYKL